MMLSKLMTRLVLLLTIVVFLMLGPEGWAEQPSLLAPQQTGELSQETLWEAARRGELARVQQAIEAGVDVDAKTAYGATALSFAADRGHLEVIRYLLDKGANPNAKDTFYNATPMTWASTAGRFEIQKALVLAGSNEVDAVLPQAIKNNDVELVKKIIESGKTSRLALKSGLLAASAIRKDDNDNQMLDLLRSAMDRFYPAFIVEKDVLKSYVGTYLSPTGQRLVIALGDSGLTLQLNDRATQPLEAHSQQRFSALVSELVFQTDAQVVTSVTETDREGSREYRRLSDEEVAALPAIDANKENAASLEIATEEFPASSPASLAADAAVSSPHWPQFRGLAARGIADGQQPPLEWNAETGKNLLWNTMIPGLGHSCPVIWENRIFLTSAISGKEADLKIGLYGDVASVEDDTEHEFITVCIAADTGEILWQRTACKRIPSVKRHLKSTHANSTVATDGRHVIAWFGSEGLYCYSMDGEPIWEKDLGLLDSGWFYDRDYQWQFGASPIIHDGRLILQCDIQDQSHLSVLDVATGEELWRTDRDEIPSWATPTVVETPNGLQIVTNATGAARGYDYATGKELWRIERNSEIAVPTPFSAHGLIYISSGYRPIQPIYAIRLDAVGDLTLSEGMDSNEFVAWSETKSGPYMPTPLVYGDYLYVCSNSGIFACYQATTGKLVYKKRLPMKGNRSFVGSPIAADGHVFVTSEEGETAVIKAGPTFDLVASNVSGENCLTTPAISGGRIFIRGQRHLFAYGVKADEQ